MRIVIQRRMKTGGKWRDCDYHDEGRRAWAQAHVAALNALPNDDFFRIKPAKRKSRRPTVRFFCNCVGRMVEYHPDEQEPEPYKMFP